MQFRKPLLALLFTFGAAGAHAAAGHNHGGHAATPCADQEAPPAMHCALAPTGAFDAEGRLWLAWASGGHVYVNHSDDLGATFSEPRPVNRIPEKVAANGENRPKIALGPDGTLHVSWTQPLEKPYTGHIRYARSSDRGRSFSEPLTVNDHREVTSHRFDSLAVNDRGEVFIAWLDKRDRMAADAKGEPYIGAALYYTLSRDGGERFMANQKIADYSCECCRTAMTLDGDGLPVIAWRQVYGDHVRDHALVTFAAADTPRQPVRLSHDQWRIDACPHHGPALSQSAGVLHAAWFNNAPERHGLFYARSTDGGRTFSQALAFGDYEAAAAHPAVVAADSVVWLAWKEFDGQQTRLMLQYSLNSGETWNQPRAMATTAGDSDHPQLLRRGEHAFASWQTEQEGFRLLPLGEVRR